jgi:hypothetical protein
MQRGKGRRMMMIPIGIGGGIRERSSGEQRRRRRRLTAAVPPTVTTIKVYDLPNDVRFLLPMTVPP